MGPIGNELANNKREIGQKALMGAAGGALGGAIKAQRGNSATLHRLWKNLGNAAARRGDEAFRPPVSSLKGLGKKMGKGALISGAMLPAGHLALKQLRGDKPAGKKMEAAGNALGGATVGALGTTGAVLGRDAYQHADTIQALSKNPASKSVPVSQLSKLKNVMSPGRFKTVAGGGALLGGLAGLGYSALKDRFSDHPKKNEVDNTSPKPKKPVRSRSRGLDNTIPDDPAAMGPRVSGANPTST